MDFGPTTVTVVLGRIVVNTTREVGLLREWLANMTET